VTAKEIEFINALRSNDPAIGYNRSPKFKIQNHLTRETMVMRRAVQ